MNWITPKLEDLYEGMECQIIDLSKCHENFLNAEEVKKVFKRDVAPQIVYKDHKITPMDIQYYTLYPHLIERDIKIQNCNDSSRE